MFPLSNLPNELLLMIGESFERSDDPSPLNSLIRTNRRFASLFTTTLDKLALHRFHPECVGLETPLLEWAIMHGNERLARLAFEKHSSPLCREKYRQMALHWAAATKFTSEAIIKLLLDNGAELQLQCSTGLTPLHIAAFHGRREAARILLEHGANITARSNYPERIGCMALHLAAISGSCATVEMLLGHGANINACTNCIGQTALHLAAMEGDSGMVEYLLGQGIRIDIRDEQGKTALHCAVEKGSVAIINQLIRNRADPTIRDSRGRTASESSPAWKSGPLRQAVSHLRKMENRALALERRSQGNFRNEKSFLLFVERVRYFIFKASGYR